MTYRFLLKKRNVLIIAALLIISVFAFSSCQLEAADKASLTVSAAAQFGARGFYGDLKDVDRIDVYIYADPDNSGESAEAVSETGKAETSEDKLVAKLTLDGSAGWTAEAPDVPTMTDLRIEAYAYGDSSVHDYDAIGWDITVEVGSDDADATGITMFTGTTSKYISSATATIYLVMMPYNDGSLQRLPRIPGMISNLNEAQLRIDFNDYGEVIWPDSTSSYEKWYWRITDSNGELAETSFEYSGTESGIPEASIQFDETNTQQVQTEDHDIVLSYLFPDDQGDDGIVDWYERVYWLEIANPQHNVLRQAFVMNPGADSFFDINFAPWIRNITAGRYDEEYRGDPSVVRWDADVCDDNEAEDIRYIWILNLDLYWAVYGDLSSVAIDAQWVDDMALMLDAQLDQQSRMAISTELSSVIAPLDEQGLALSEGTGVDSDGLIPAAGNSSSVMSASGSIFDDETLSGSLYLLAFDGEFESGESMDGNVNSYDDYSWSYVRMEIDSSSFPSIDGGGLIVFE